MILITFDDGSTDLRWEGSPCVSGETLTPPWTPNNVVSIFSGEYNERWFVTDMDHALESEDGWTSEALPIWHSTRGLHYSFWRITGGDETTGALRGEWQAGRAETYGEQIDRLERERDAIVLHAKERFASAISVIGLNNNAPRVIFRNGPVEIVRSHRALADMRLPDNVQDARSIRSEALTALTRALTEPHVMPPYVMERDIQPCPRGSYLDVVPDLADEVESHRGTQEKLRHAETYADEMADACEKHHEAFVAEKTRADAATTWGTQASLALRLTTRALSLATSGAKDSVTQEVLARAVAEAAEALQKAQPGITFDIGKVCARLAEAETIPVERPTVEAEQEKTMDTGES